MKNYYAQRAAYFEEIYAIPERQDDLAALRSRLVELLAGQDVLEVACGTGYWTAPVARVAHSLVATDAVDETLELARAKTWPASVRFERRDAWDLGRVEGRFTAGLAAFWWSHVPRERLTDFLRGLHARVGSGLYVYCDNPHVPGSSTPITRTDGHGNTYQTRVLKDGSVHEVLKNYYSEDELWALASDLGATEVEYVQWKWYWCLNYKVV